MNGKRLILLAASISLVALWGCSSSMDSDSDDGGGGGSGVTEVGSTSCSTCHSGGSTYVASVYDLWAETRHGNQDGSPDGHDPVADPGDGCIPCHAGPDIDYVTFGNAIGCERCHGGGSVHRGVGPLPEPQPGPDVCRECHGLMDGDQGFHSTSVNRQIWDTHYDDPTTYDSILDDPGPPEVYEYESILEGYIVRAGQNSGCYECHDVHSTDLKINEEWARSPHAGHFLDVKDAASTDDIDVRYDAALTEADTGAFIHGGWSGSCQRCHTSTGGSNFLDDPLGYDSDDNDWSHFATGAQDGRQDELIYCWACHSNGHGGMRLPPLEDLPIYDRDDVIRGEIDVADAGNSIVCVGCHAGRANGEYVRETAQGSRSGSGRIHHRPAAGTLYAEETHIGYEFDLDSDTDAAEHYENDELEHHEINEGTNNAGPCASCHMYDTSHSFAVVEKDVLGDYTAINSQTLCNDCHDGTPLVMDEVVLQGLSDGFQDALLFLENIIQDIEDNYADEDFSDQAVLRLRPDDVSGQNDYGAFQNYEYLADDPGAFAHNSYYAKWIIFDSINWLQHGNFVSATIDLTGYSDAATWLDPGYGDISAIGRPSF